MTDHPHEDVSYVSGRLVPTSPAPAADRSLRDEVDYLRKLLYIAISLLVPTLFFALVAAAASGYVAYVVQTVIEAVDSAI